MDRLGVSLVPATDDAPGVTTYSPSGPDAVAITARAWDKAVKRAQQRPEPEQPRRTPKLAPLTPEDWDG